MWSDNNVHLFFLPVEEKMAKMIRENPEGPICCIIHFMLLCSSMTYSSYSHFTLLCRSMPFSSYVHFMLLCWSMTCRLAELAYTSCCCVGQ